METGILVALIAAISGLVGILINNGASVFTRFKFDEPVHANKLQSQLLDVFAPIHKIINQTKGVLDQKSIDDIAKIIDENYVLVSTEIFENFNQLKEDFGRLNTDEHLRVIDVNDKEFYRLINESFKVTRSQLGYTQFKYDTKDKTIKNNLSKTTSHKRLVVVLIIVGLLSIYVQSTYSKIRDSIPIIKNDFGGDRYTIAPPNVLVPSKIYYTLGEYEPRSSTTKYEYIEGGYIEIDYIFNDDGYISSVLVWNNDTLLGLFDYDDMIYLTVQYCYFNRIWSESTSSVIYFYYNRGNTNNAGGDPRN